MGASGNAMRGEICAHHRPAGWTRFVSGIEHAACQDRDSQRRERIAANDTLLLLEAASIDSRAGERAATNLGIPRVIVAGRRGVKGAGRRQRGG